MSNVSIVLLCLLGFAILQNIGLSLKVQSTKEDSQKKDKEINQLVSGVIALNKFIKETLDVNKKPEQKEEYHKLLKKLNNK